MVDINLNNEFKDKDVKNLVRLLLFVLIVVLTIFSIITIQKISNNEYVKLFGIEFNIPIIQETQNKMELPHKDSISKSASSNKIESIKPLEKKSLEVKNMKDNFRTNQAINGKNINMGTNYGHIGDVNEREFTEADKIGLINYIEGVKKKHDLNSNCIFMSITSNSNGGKVASQIEDYLISKGYSIVAHGNEIGPPVKGVVIDKIEDCISITVGTL